MNSFVIYVPTFRSVQANIYNEMVGLQNPPTKHSVTIGTLFGQDMHEFLPFLAAGNVVWALLSMMITEVRQKR